MKKKVSLKAQAILFMPLFLLLSTTAFCQESAIELLITRNDSLRGGITEFLLHPVNHTENRIYVEHFPSMASIHVFVIGADGVVYRPTRVSSPKKNEFYSRKRFCLFPSAKSGFIFSVEKGNGFGIEKAGAYFIIYAIRKPNLESGIILSSLSEFTIDEKHEIVRSSTISADRLPTDIKNTFRAEIQNTMGQEGLPLLRADIPF